ncbi:hypothetical protein PKB_5409 [Pseudomonas knackmussii B13]|uniref:Uncharacterized protein n=1 Tax=Pseudomonas knackmussii (strain DSM 6978 / CCUG 54928 / LMG 23759 / B13) TaxID=1301098 RepID=A0A024HPE1_PSEKB|nr:hypothetical protein PKB_5409 [Pseudomonas knackmussii B13]
MCAFTARNKGIGERRQPGLFGGSIRHRPPDTIGA